MRIFLIIFLLLTFIGPIYVALSGQIDFKSDYKTANRQSAKLAPDAVATTEAVIQVYYARTFNWRGIFGVHSWIAVKAKGSKQYNVYQLIGWRLYRKLNPIVTDYDIPDRYWYAQKPILILDMRGVEAEALIPQILTAIKSYPYPEIYHYWPGPNSNSFIAHIGRQVPVMQLALPSNAVGKDYLSPNTFLSKTPSGTGYQLSFYGVFGIMLAKKEGFELNILGLVYGISLHPFTLKLPGFGDLQPF